MTLPRFHDREILGTEILGTDPKIAMCDMKTSGGDCCDAVQIILIGGDPSGSAWIGLYYGAYTKVVYHEKCTKNCGSRGGTMRTETEIKALEEAK